MSLLQLNTEGKRILRRYIKMQKDFYRREISEEIAIKMIFNDINKFIDLKYQQAKEEFERKQIDIYGYILNK